MPASPRTIPTCHQTRGRGTPAPSSQSTATCPQGICHQCQVARTWEEGAFCRACYDQLLVPWHLPADKDSRYLRSLQASRRNGVKTPETAKARDCRCLSTRETPEATRPPTAHQLTYNSKQTAGSGPGRAPVGAPFGAFVENRPGIASVPACPKARQKLPVVFNADLVHTDRFEQPGFLAEMIRQQRDRDRNRKEGR